MYVVHHSTETLLLLFSLACRFTRFGIVVFLIHDPSDLFLQLAKVSEYTTRHPSRKNWKFLVTLWFVLFALCWLVLRLILLPFLFSGIWTDVVNPMEVLVKNITRLQNIKLLVRLVFSGLAGALYVLHVWWFVMILKIAYRIVAKTNLRDTRSDDENDPEVKQAEREAKEQNKENKNDNKTD
jgi:hypothetical protein